VDVVRLKLEDLQLKETRSRERLESMTPVCTAMRHDGVCRTIYDAAIHPAQRADDQSTPMVGEEASNLRDTKQECLRKAYPKGP
jgi:hypothetical protein